MNNLRILSGNANILLAQAIADDLGKPLVKAEIGVFRDGETQVEILESVRGADVFVIQSTCPPVNQNLMELLIMLDALKRASPVRITAVIPYYGYGRQDRKVAPRAPISAKAVAKMIESTGVDRVLAMDLHAGQIQGFFDIPVDQLYASSVILKDLIDRQISNPVIVSPDAGGVERARYYGKMMNADIAMVDKRRKEANESRVMRIVGNVKDKVAILVDDMIDTGGTIVQASDAILNEGATEAIVVCTHPVLSGQAVERLAGSRIKEVIVTDTIPLNDKAKACPKIKVLSVCTELAEAVRRIHNDESVSSMFDSEQK